MEIGIVMQFADFTPGLRHLLHAVPGAEMPRSLRQSGLRRTYSVCRFQAIVVYEFHFTFPAEGISHNDFAGSFNRVIHPMILLL